MCISVHTVQHVSVYVSEKPVGSYCTHMYSAYVFECVLYMAPTAEFQGRPGSITIWPHVKRTSSVQLFALDTPESNGVDTLITTWP